jgi:hypothetical protein
VGVVTARKYLFALGPDKWALPPPAGSTSFALGLKK